MDGKIQLETDSDIAPAVMSPHRVPVALKEKLHDK